MTTEAKQDKPKTAWPTAYYDAERTIEVRIPGGQRIVRIGFDAKSGEWTPTAIVMLAKGLRKNHDYANVPMEVVVDWVATLKGVTFVHVLDNIEAAGYHVGTYARLRPYDTEERIVKVVDDNSWATLIGREIEKILTWLRLKKGK